LYAGAAVASFEADARDQPGGNAPPVEVRRDDRGMGAIADAPRDRDPRAAAESALARRGDVRTDLAFGDGSDKKAEAASFYLKAIDRYVGRSGQRRLEALAAAEQAKSGAAQSSDVKRSREALEKDLAAWRDAFGFDKATWQDQRTQWLAERDGMSAADWAVRRAEWFAARDQWIEQQREWAAEQAKGK
jgi:hypothetical protein